MTERFTVLASDFHLTPQAPREIEVFVEFTKTVVRGAERFCVLGDLFEYWVGRHQLGVPEIAPVFAAFSELAAEGTQILLFHGNRDFLLGRAEGRAAGGVVVGEEHAIDLYGRRCLLMHGDSLCTRDIDYQKSKKILRSGFVRFLSVVLPSSAAHGIARKLRRKSTNSVSRKDAFTMGIVDDEVRRRAAQGFETIVCGHVHRPERRSFEVAGRTTELVVLGDWHGGGVFAIAKGDGIALLRYAAGGSVTAFPGSP